MPTLASNIFTVTVSSSASYIRALPQIIATDPAVGDTVTYSPGDYLYTNGTASLSWETLEGGPIPNATGPTLTIPEDRVGQNLIIVETPNNGYGIPLGPVRSAPILILPAFVTSWDIRDDVVFSAPAAPDAPLVSGSQVIG